ncbi:MAG: polynucleotide adenylyltransferase PcnB [Gammaproteobacteria bacterium]|nr:polynucleotide adenylyltransferase PcnB [Gammaproteobacteria bacterium]
MNKHSLKITPGCEHQISQDAISQAALQVVEGLQQAGFDGLLVGGCVRDLMLGREPKDFDAVTNATPEEIKGLFRSARLIGRRFRLAHVRFGREVIEVATYRAAPSEVDEDRGGHMVLSEEGRLLHDNVYGNQTEDARRRDFTVNALYFDTRDASVIDHVNGMDDLRKGVLRIIGDPATRYREDPVRMLRAIRFAAKLGFRLEKKTAAPLRELAPLLQDVPPARLFEEVVKLFHGGYAAETYELLRQYHLFEQLFPLTDQGLALEEEHFPLTLLPRALANTDSRISEHKPVTPAFLFAAVLWEPVRIEAQHLMDEGSSWLASLQDAAEVVLRDQLRHVAIPKRFSFPMREIWAMQARLERRGGKRAFSLVEHKRFRAGYDFLLLRADSGEADPELAQWWTRFQEVDHEEKQRMVSQVSGGQRKRRRPRKRKHASPH